MNQTSPAALIRELKGSPLSIFCALLVARFENRLPVGEKWLIVETGWSQNKVREGLLYLANRQIVVKSGRYKSWSLTDEAYKLPLTLALSSMVTTGEPGQLGPAITKRESQNLDSPGYYCFYYYSPAKRFA